MMALRAQAALAVAAVLRGRSLDDVLPVEADGFTRALIYGVIREHSLLDWLCGRLLDKAITAELRALLLCGLHQLRSMDVAAHAAVNETVNACEDLKQPKARGLVNAILRRYQREQADLEAALPADPGLRFSHPDWLLRQLRADWPQHWPDLLEQNNRQAPMVLRVNRRRQNREAYLQTLRAAGIGAQPLDGAADGLVLDAPCAVSTLPGFAEGWVSVQDGAAQLAADLLEVSDGQRVLDACAAPGGKAAHLLERYALDLTAVDQDARRLSRVDETLARLGLKATTLAADASRPSTWWDDRPYDRILLDAPCSGTGVIRRHPDIKWLRREADIPRLALQQQRLLDALWPLLAPGGALLYATCSVLQAEGDRVVADFLARRPDATTKPLDAPWGFATVHGRRTLPGGAMDGFYYAKFVKTPSKLA